MVMITMMLMIILSAMCVVMQSRYIIISALLFIIIYNRQYAKMVWLIKPENPYVGALDLPEPEWAANADAYDAMVIRIQPHLHK